MKEWTIFLVDDDELYTSQLKQQLSEMEQVNIREFTYVERAIANLNQKPDLIILDHHLNGENGTNAIPLLKEKHPDCVIAMLSGSDDVNVLAQATQNGATYFFAKDDKVITNLAMVIEKDLASRTTPQSFLRAFIDRYKLPENDTIRSVFIVEDDEMFSYAIRYRLDKNPDINTQIFKGTDVIEALETQPDLIILDYHLLDTTGDVICEKLKEVSPSTHVIVLSSQQDMANAIRLKELGVERYIVKNSKWTKNLEEALQAYAI